MTRTSAVGTSPFPANRDLGENGSRALHPVPRGSSPRANEVWSPLRRTAKKNHWDFIPPIAFFILSKREKTGHLSRPSYAKSALKRLFGEGKKI